MKHPYLNALLALTIVAGASTTWVACSSDSTVKESPAPTSTSTSPGFDAGTLPDGGAKDCFDNPTTHFEIINGCTKPDVTRITKNPTLTKLLPDGGLPPLQ